MSLSERRRLHAAQQGARKALAVGPQPTSEDATHELLLRAQHVAVLEVARGVLPLVLAHRGVARTVHRAAQRERARAEALGPQHAVAVVKLVGRREGAHLGAGQGPRG